MIAPERRWLPLLFPLLLGACSVSPPENFHVLTRYAGDSVSAMSPAVRSYGIVVGPVALPDLVNRPQLVISTAPGRVEIKEQQRWAGALPADVAQALAEQLALALPAAYVYSQERSPAHVLPPRYRVALDVQRFESRLSGREAGAIMDVAWVLTEVATERRQACRSVARAALDGSGYAALVQAHQRALADISVQIATMLSALTAGQGSAEPPAGVRCQA